MYSVRVAATTTLIFVDVHMQADYVEPLKSCLCTACTVFSRASAHERLKSMGHKMGVVTFTDKPFVCITHIYVNHRIIKRGGGPLHGDERLRERIWYVRAYTVIIPVASTKSVVCALMVLFTVCIL